MLRNLRKKSCFQKGELAILKIVKVYRNYLITASIYSYRYISFNFGFGFVAQSHSWVTLSPTIENIAKTVENHECIKGRNQYYYYYHCSSQCGCRYKAEDVNIAFEGELKKYTLDSSLKELCTAVLLDVYNNENNESRDESMNRTSA